MSLAELGAAERLKIWSCNRVPFLHCPTVSLLSIPLGNPSAEAPIREELGKFLGVHGQVDGSLSWPETQEGASSETGSVSSAYQGS